MVFESSGHTGAMIALTVPDPETYAIAPQTDDSVPADELHITLGYLGEATDISPEQRAAILDACQTLADSTPAPEALFPATSGVFPPDPESGDETPKAPYYAAPANPERFNDIREDLLVHMGARGVGDLVSRKHPVFTPHVTLAYAPLDSPPSLDHLPTPLLTQFSNLVVKFGDEVHEFQLIVPETGPELPLTASVRNSISSLSKSHGVSEEYLTALYLRQRQVRSTPSQTRARAALDVVTASIDSGFRPDGYARVKKLIHRVNLEPDPAGRVFIASRALALAARTPAPKDVMQARELAGLTASLQALVADGNSSVARSLRARSQLRDRFGRWIEEGGGVRFKIRVPGAPGGGTWYHGIVQGFDIPNKRVLVKLSDDRIVKIPNDKIEQPKAILGLNISKKLKSFVPKSRDRITDATSDKHKARVEQKANQSTLDDAAIPSIEDLKAEMEPDASGPVTGGHVTRFADAETVRQAVKDAEAAGQDTINMAGPVAPFKEKPVSANVAALKSVQDALDARIKANLPSDFADLGPDEQKKALSKARGGAISGLGGLSNDSKDADAKELRQAPSVGTEADLEEVAPEDVPAPEEVPHEDVVKATEDALAELKDRVSEDSPLAAPLNRIEKSLTGANSRLLSGEDDYNTYLDNLDKIKNFSNEQEPSTSDTTPEQQAFGSFAEDIDDAHAAGGGTDSTPDAASEVSTPAGEDFSEVKQVLAEVDNAINNEAGAEGDNGPIGMDEGLLTVEKSVQNIEDKLKKGTYSGNSDELKQDLGVLKQDVADNFHSDDRISEVLDAIDTHIASLPDSSPETPAEEPTTSPATSDSPSFDRTSANPSAYESMTKNELIDEAAKIFEAQGESPATAASHALSLFDKKPKSRIIKGLNELNKPKESPAPIDYSQGTPEAPNAPAVDTAEPSGTSEDYTDAPEGASEPVKEAWDSYSNLAGAIYELTNGGPSGEYDDSALSQDAKDSLHDLEAALDEWYQTATETNPDMPTLIGVAGEIDLHGNSLADALDDPQHKKDIQETTASFVKNSDAWVGDVTGDNTAALGYKPLEPTFDDFSNIYVNLGDVHDELMQQGDSTAQEVAAFGNTVANVGKELDQGKITHTEASQALGNALDEMNTALENSNMEQSTQDSLNDAIGEVQDIKANLDAIDSFPEPLAEGAPEPTQPEDAPDVTTPNTSEDNPTGLAGGLTVNDIHDRGDTSILDVIREKTGQVGAPKILDAESFDKLDSPEIYRGATTVDAINNLYSDSPKMGTGGSGDGLYFTDDKSEARGYSGGGGANDDKVATAKLSPDANLISADDLIKEITKLDDKPDPSIIEQFISSQKSTVIASALGYDGIVVPENGGHGTFTIITNPKALILRDRGSDLHEEDTNAPADSTTLDAWANTPAVESVIDSTLNDGPGSDQIHETAPELDEPLAEWEKELLGYKNHDADNPAEAIKDINQAADRYHAALESISDNPEADDPAKSIAAGEADRVTKAKQDLLDAAEADGITENAPAAQVPDEANQAIIDQLNAQGSPISKVIAQHLQDKVDAGEPLTEDDFAAIKGLIDFVAPAESNSPEDTADFNNVSDALDPQHAAAPDPDPATEVPATPEAPDSPVAVPDTSEPASPEIPAEFDGEFNAPDALSTENALDVWGQQLQDHLDKNGGAEAAELVSGKNHNPLSEAQATNLQKIIDGLPDEIDAALQPVFDAHQAGTTTDDALVQAISTALLDMPWGSKARTQLKGAQAGIQTNNAPLVPILRPKPAAYAKGKTFSEEDLSLPTPDQVKGTINAVIQQSAAGADLKHITGGDGSTDAQVQAKITAAESLLKNALDQFNEANPAEMVTWVRKALDSYDESIALRNTVHKNDKIVRRLRARRRALDETLAPFEGRWPDPVNGGTYQKYQGAYDYNNATSHTDVNGNAVYPGDQIERTHKTAKGQTAMVLGWRGDESTGYQAHLWLDAEKKDRPQGVAQNQFVIKAVGPNNPLFHDPTYTGPKVGDDIFNEFKDAQDKKVENQAKKAAKTGVTPVPESVISETPDTPEVAAEEPSAEPDINEDGPTWNELTGFETKASSTEAPTTPDGQTSYFEGTINGRKVRVEKEQGDNTLLYTVTSRDGTVTETYNKSEAVAAINGFFFTPDETSTDDDNLAGPDVISNLNALPVGTKISVASNGNYAGYDGVWTKTEQGWSHPDGDGVVTSHFDDPEVNSIHVVDDNAAAPEEPPPTSPAKQTAMDAIDAATSHAELNVLDQAIDDNPNLTPGEKVELHYRVASQKNNITAAQDSSDESTGDFTPLPPSQQGASGDGYVVSPSGKQYWGKYGAAGIAITATDPADGKKKVLIGKKGSTGKWYLPGGALEQKETPQQGAAREFAEETSSELTDLNTLNHIAQHVYTDPNGADWKYTTFVAEAPSTFDVKSTAKSKNSKELVDFMWADADDLQKLEDKGDLLSYLAGGRLAEKAGLNGVPTPSGPDNLSENSAPEVPQDPETPSVTASTPIDISKWKKVGGKQGGSNAGNVLQDPEGNKYYVKSLKSDDHAHLEALASDFYKLFDINAADVKTGTDNTGKIYAVSKWEDITADAPEKMKDPAWLKKVHDGFAIDAWLSNYDVVGGAWDNLTTDANGEPFRMDNGSSFMYKAQGGTKPWWGDDVTDLEDMRSDSWKFKQRSWAYGPTAKLFGSMTDEDVKESAKKLLNVSSEQIKNLVNSSGLSPAKKKELADTLIKRRHDILEKTGLLTPNVENASAETDKNLDLLKDAKKEMVADDSVKGAKTTPPPGGWSKLSKDGITDVEIGQTVTGSKGLTGTVVKFTHSGYYAHVKDADGKIKIRRPETLTVQSGAPNSAEVTEPKPIFTDMGHDYMPGESVEVYSIDAATYLHGTLMDEPVTSTKMGNSLMVEIDGQPTPWLVDVGDIVPSQAHAKSAAKPAFNSSEAAQGNLGPGYAEMPEGSTPMLKNTYGNVIVMDNDGNLQLYKKDGSVQPAYSQNIDSYSGSPSWSVFQYPDSTEPATTPETTGNTLPPNYVPVPDGSKIVKVSTNAPASLGGKTYIVENADGSTTAHYANGDSSDAGATAEHFPAPFWEDYNSGVSSEEPTNPPAPLTLPSGYTTMLENSKVIGKSTNPALPTVYMVQAPNGVVTLHYSGGGTSELAASLDDYLNSEWWTPLGDGPADPSVAPTIPDVQQSNTGPMSAWGDEIHVGDVVSNKGGTKQGVVTKVSPSGQVTFRIQDAAGNDILDAKGKPKKGTYTSTSLKHISKNSKPKFNGAPASPGAPELIYTEPDTNSPLYGTPKPVAPSLSATQVDMVDSAWIDKANTEYKARQAKKHPEKANKDIQDSSLWHRYQNIQQNGSDSDLDFLLNGDYISQATYDDAKSQIAAKMSVKAAAVADFEKQLDEHNSKLIAWQTAHGQPILKLSGPDFGWKTSRTEAVAWMNANMKPTNLTSAEKSAANSQKGSGGWKSTLYHHPKNIALDDASIKAVLDAKGNSHAWEVYKGIKEGAKKNPMKRAMWAIRTIPSSAFHKKDGSKFSGKDNMLQQIIGTIQKDPASAEMTPGFSEAGGKPGMDIGGKDVIMDILIPEGMPVIWTGGGGFSHTGEHGLLPGGAIGYYIHDVVPGNQGTGSGKQFKWRVIAEMIPADFIGELDNLSGTQYDPSVLKPGDPLPGPNDASTDAPHHPNALIEGGIIPSSYYPDLDGGTNA